MPPKRSRCCVIHGRKIVFRSGFWWFMDGSGTPPLRIDGLFSSCEWNVSLIAASIGLNKRTFIRLVADSLGMNPKEWLRHLRVVEARHMLREGTKIQIVARKLGFRHDSDFTRDFKDLMGVTPSRFAADERMRSFDAGHDGGSFGRFS